MFTIDRIVAFSETGPDNMLKVTGLFDYYQDVCTFHSEDLGVGTQYLKSKGIAWVASSWQVIVYRYPKLDERIRVGTAPYEFKGAMGMRYFKMETADGEVLSVANSIWSLINRETLSLIRVTPDIVAAYELDPKPEMEYAPRKIAIPKGTDAGQDGAGSGPEFVALTPIPVEYRHLDFNNHVNNAQYVAMAEDVVPEGRRARQIRVEYRASARPGDIIYPYVCKKEELITVILADAESKPYVLVEFTV